LQDELFPNVAARCPDSFGTKFVPMHGNASPVEDGQSFVDGDPYQPTAESAVAVKCPDMAKSREQTIFYSNISLVRIAKYAVGDKMEQAAISRCLNIKGRAPFRRSLPDRGSSVQLRFQVQFGTHFIPRFLYLVLCVI